MDEEGESEFTELLSMPKVCRVEKKAPPGKQGIPKNATMVVSSELRLRPCDQCEKQKQLCLPRSKGGQLLEACKGCFTRKLSCWTTGRGRRKKQAMGERNARKLRESSKSDGESNMSRREWLKTFSTMKFGLPKHIKTVAGLRHGTSGARPAS